MLYLKLMARPTLSVMKLHHQQKKKVFKSIDVNQDSVNEVDEAISKLGNWRVGSRIGEGNLFLILNQTN
ncbi:hypothetical protein Hdeb2414_s0135g00808461 [Helianthus debilis subsp. tardiflorus]